MRLRRIGIIARKDMAELRTNKYIMFSLVLMPLIVALVLPTLYILPFTFLAESSEPYDLDITLTEEVIGENVYSGSYSNTTFRDCVLDKVVLVNCYVDGCEVHESLIKLSYIENSTIADGAVMDSNILNIDFDDVVVSDIRDLEGNDEQKAILMQFIDFLLLFFILIPAILPTVIASYTFVGEKLNRSLEPLLATPTTDAELLIGKSLSIFMPTMALVWVSFIPFVLLVNFLTTPVIGHSPLPDPTWIIGVFFMAPLFCIMAIALNVIVSSRVTDVRAAQQLGSLVVLPIVMIFIVSLSGLFSLGPLTILILTIIIGAIDLIIASVALKTFQREEILVRWK